MTKFLKDKTIRVNVTGNLDTVVRTFLQISLSSERLTTKQLDVTTALVKRYYQYVIDGVVEPYASTLLFSTQVRKEITEELGITSAHLNNTFNALTGCNVLAKDDKKYFLNPGILPVEELQFKFSIQNGQPATNHKRDSKKIESSSNSGAESSGVAVPASTEDDSE